MTQHDNIKVGKSGGVARVTLDRPKHNVFNIDMVNTLSAALKDLGTDPELKCVVLAAAGPSWCAGVDVGDHKPEKVDRMIAAFNESLTLLEKMEIPTIAAVNGACLGGGMEYAIACDMVVASEKATFGQPEVKLGFLPPYAAIRLPQLVGPAKAIEICTTGRTYSAHEAHLMGFVGKVASDEEFHHTVDKLTKELKAASPLILRLNKKAVKTHLAMPFDAALAGVSDLFLNTLMKTEDTAEGIASFYEKRKPVWKNR